MSIERQTIHISDDTGRIAMKEVRTQGTDPAPASLTRYIYSNHLQSASLELDENAAIISYEEYHPYGTTSYQANNTAINAVAKRYRYTGKERDEESGLYYYGARYYIPWLCRWTATDPINSENYNLQKGYGLEKNKKRSFLKFCSSSYEYCGNNPVNYLDPDGNDEIHFSYKLLPFTDDEGNISKRLVLSVEIIKNELEHTFFMHSPTGETTQFYPFKSDLTPYQTSFEASRDELPLSISSKSFLGFEVYRAAIDDYTYLGKLLKIAPEVLEHYKGAKDGTGTRMYHSERMAKSVDFYEKLIAGTRVVYAIDGAYAITRGLSSFIVRGLNKNAAKATTKSIPKVATEAAKKTENFVRITGVEDDVMMFSAKIGKETVEGIANFAVKDGKLFLNQLHLQGSSAGNVGTASLFKMAKDLGKQYNVKEVIIQGGRRTTGKYKGQVPTPITIKVN